MTSDNGPSCCIRALQQIFLFVTKLIGAITSPVLIVILLFFAGFSILYFFGSYRNGSPDVADILGTIATLMIAGAVLFLQFVSYRNDVQKRREDETRDVLLNISELFFENTADDPFGNKYNINHGEEVPYPYTNKRYLVFWKFEYIDSTDKFILEVGCRRLYGKSRRYYYRSTVIVAIEIVSTGNFVKSYRNDRNLDALEEKGRKNVKFSNFTSKEWDTAMEIMPRKLFEYFGSFVPTNIAP